MALPEAETFKHFRLNPPIFRAHEYPVGFLPNLPAAHACWYYCRNAMRMMEKVDDKSFGLYEGDLDPLNRLHQLAKSVALLYRLESPEDFLKFLEHCETEALRCDLPWDNRIRAPYKAQITGG